MKRSCLRKASRMRMNRMKEENGCLLNLTKTSLKEVINLIKSSLLRMTSKITNRMSLKAMNTTTSMGTNTTTSMGTNRRMKMSTIIIKNHHLRLTREGESTIKMTYATEKRSTCNMTIDSPTIWAPHSG